MWIIPGWAWGIMIAGSAGSAAIERPTSAAAPATAPAAAPDRQPIAEPTPGNIRAAVRDLRHPSPARRQAATERLAAWGPIAFPQLREAAAGSDLEAALLARDLLAELQDAIFLGARVRLEIEPAQVAWDQPFDLVLVAENITPGPLRVPWPAPPASQPASAPAGAAVDATQVAAMMDIADFLTVTGPDGAALDVRVDPIERDEAVFEAVSVRAGDSPPSHELAPGASSRLRVEAFNRGWARYPMLVAGRYRIAFAYQPRWRDPRWNEAGYGRVSAAPVEAEITSTAPAQARRGSRPLDMELRRADGYVEAWLLSTWDRVQWVNLNLGTDLDTQARIEWRLQPLRDGEVEPVTFESDMTGDRFELERVRPIEPAGSLLIARVDERQLLERGLKDEVQSQVLEVTARYSHPQARLPLMGRLKELGRERVLPLELFTGSAASAVITIEDRSK